MAPRHDERREELNRHQLCVTDRGYGFCVCGAKLYAHTAEALETEYRKHLEAVRRMLARY